MGTYLSSLPRSPSPLSKSPNPCRTSSVSNLLVDPALAFIKAYRLKGDKLGLKQAVLAAFDAASLGSAHTNIWDSCRDDLLTLA